MSIGCSSSRLRRRRPRRRGGRLGGMPRPRPGAPGRAPAGGAPPAPAPGTCWRGPPPTGGRPRQAGRSSRSGRTGRAPTLARRGRDRLAGGGSGGTRRWRDRLAGRAERCLVGGERALGGRGPGDPRCGWGHLLRSLRAPGLDRRNRGSGGRNVLRPDRPGRMLAPARGDEPRLGPRDLRGSGSGGLLVSLRLRGRGWSGHGLCRCLGRGLRLGSRLGRGLHLRRLLGGGLRRLLLGLLVADQPLALGLAPDAIGLGLDDAGRMTLHPDTEGVTQIQRLLVGEPELPCELVDPNLACHRPPASLLPVCCLSVGRISAARVWTPLRQHHLRCPGSDCAPQRYILARQAAKIEAHRGARVMLRRSPPHS